MKIKIFTLSYILILCSFSSSAQIQNWLNFIQFKVDNFTSMDRSTVVSEVDSAINYFRCYSPYDSTFTLCEGKCFLNHDGTSVFIISGLDEDEQCYRYKHFCFMGNPDKGLIEKVQLQSLFADSLIYSMRKKNQKKVETVILKYLPEIKKNYLGENASIELVWNEIYDLRLSFNPEKNQLFSTYTVCDYIPTNAVSIEPEDWQIIIDAVGIDRYNYSNDTRTFKKK